MSEITILRINSRQEHRIKQMGIESEYVIPANIGRMVKASNIISTFKAFYNHVGVEYKPSHTCRRSYVTNCLDKGMKLLSKDLMATPQIAPKSRSKHSKSP